MKQPTDVCLVTDRVFLEHFAERDHPENPERLQSVYAMLAESPIFSCLPVLTPRVARVEELGRIHVPAMLEALQSTRGRQGWFDADTYFNPRSAEVASLAAGSTIELALAIWRGDYRRGFSLVRPPGHHATVRRPMGFCLYNNVALAVAAVRSVAPAARLAVVDFDLHHGNGTQDLFYCDPDILFLSSHRYPFYPGTGALDETGDGMGRGTTVNFPLGRRFGDDTLALLYRRLAFPILEEFAPDMLFVSAGFDGHERDPMNGFALTTGFYGGLAEGLLAIAEERGGKILFCLEGGYDPTALAESTAEVLGKLCECRREPFAIRSFFDGESLDVDHFVSFFRSFFPSLSGG